MKIAIVLLALVAIAVAKPFGGAVVSQNHVSSSVVSPHLGLGYGMMGYPGLGVGHTISSHSVAHAVPHYGMGMMGIKGMCFKDTELIFLKLILSQNFNQFVQIFNRSRYVPRPWNGLRRIRSYGLI